MAVKLRITGGGEGKKKPAKSTTPTPAELEAANKFAKNFALRRGLVSGENTNVGNQVPQFIDAKTGLPAVAAPPIGKFTNKVPAYVTSLEWDHDSNLPYYIDEKTGDTQYVDKDLFYSPRFRKAAPMKPLQENPLGNIR